MAISKNFAVKAALTLLLAGAFGFLAFSSQFYSEALVDAFFAFGLGSIVILHFRVRPSWADAVFVLACAAVFAAVDFRFLHYSPRVMAWLSFLGLASFLVLAVRIVWTEARDRRMLLYAWVPAALFVISDYFASNMLEWTAAAHPKTLDLYLLSFESSLHVQLSFLAGRLYYRSVSLHNAALIFYVALAIPIAIVYAGQLIRVKEKSFPAMLAFLIAGPLGILFYNLFPAAGPHNLLPRTFPFYPPRMDLVRRLLLEPVAIAGPRNAMPSLHMAWTLLAWWYSRGLSWWERTLAFAFVAFTVLATLGTGEHWFIDLIVAFPFALFVQAICAYHASWNDSRRLSAFFFGLMGTLAWFIALRYAPRLFWTSPVVPWALAAATVTVACIRQSKLREASDTPAARESAMNCAHDPSGAEKILAGSTS